MADIQLWEVLVPTVMPDGKPIKLRFHRVWDERVRSIAGGLTIYKPVTGQWSSDVDLYIERVIPVRIACTEGQIDEIARMTIEYYDQQAVMYYRVSNKVVIMRRDDDEALPIDQPRDRT